MAESVARAVARTFRPEFVNRIDRVVVFRPLSREVLREILHKELRDVFGWRGLRNRDRAVVWDETALDFLLDRSTTPDLGARPLKRAIEQHVLAPLARTIVEHEYPRGDQFLFVRSGGAVTCLESHVAGLAAAVEDPRWRERKRAALDRQHEPGFWDSPARFAVFGTIEQMDRIEGGGRTAPGGEALPGAAEPSRPRRRAGLADGADRPRPGRRLRPSRGDAGRR